MMVYIKFIVCIFLYFFYEIGIAGQPNYSDDVSCLGQTQKGDVMTVKLNLISNYLEFDGRKWPISILPWH